MRQFKPNPTIVNTINKLDNHPFRITQLRDMFIQLNETGKSHSELRRWLHGSMPSFVKHGLLKKVRIEGGSATHYQPTSNFSHLVRSTAADKSILTKDKTSIYLKKRLHKWQNEILVILGAIEEIEEIKKERDDIADKLTEKYDAFIDKSKRIYGKIQLLEEMIQTSI